MSSDLAKFHNVSCFFAALAHGAENAIGQSANSVCFLAGKRLAREAIEKTDTTTDPVQALRMVTTALAQRGISWEGEEFQGEREHLIECDGAVKRMRLIFRTCMVRNTLFTYAREQKQSLCYFSHGIFAGAMEKIMPGSSVKIEIIQACPEACIEEMVWEEKQ